MMNEISKRKTAHRIGVIVSSLLLMLAISCFTPKHTKAAESISVKEINYNNSTITLQVNEGDTEVYFSDSKKSSWERVPGAVSSTNTITMDISWVSTSTNYIMTFKGNKSTGIISATIPKQATNFKATYNKVKGTITFSNAGTRTVEWRKKDSTIWYTVNTSTISTELSYLCNNGANLYFRLAPMNGTGVTNVGFRPSKEVSVAIPKKTAAPVITVDGSKFSIAVKKGMAYRTVNTDGSTTDWTNINSTTDLLLTNVAAKAMYPDGTTAQSEVTLQFRTNATSTAQVSKISTVTVPVQEGPPDENTYGITLNYTSSSTVSLQVKAATNTIPFEYTIVKKDDTLIYKSASWNTISSSAAITLDSKKAPTGSHIYVRKKSVAATETVAFALASVERDITGAAGVTYLNAPKASTLTTLISTAGVCQTSKSASYLTFLLYSPTSTTVSSIRFLDAYGIDKGTVTCKSTVAKNSSSSNPDERYIITTKITSTSSIDTITKETLYAEITLANSEVITSTPTTGVLLYLYPSTKVNNPAEEEEYTDEFTRIYLSDETGDDRSFKFQLDFGTAKIIDPSGIDKYTSEDVLINSIKYDGYTLKQGTDFTVEYGSYINEDEDTIATATVTVNVSEFEDEALIDTTDQALPLVINLNNGETLDKDIDITLTSTATIDNVPIAWSITEGSLKETKTSIITNPDNTTTTVTEDVITYTITLTIFDRTYPVSVADVTWNGISVFGSAVTTNGKATINLSNAKINKLTTDATDTKNIVITLSNGFVLKSGCKLTILNAS
jgi:hypothetical protein